MFRRARNVCECGCGRYINAEQGHLDHFFGRGKVAQTEANCWALTIFCDHRKTNNDPTRAYWLRKFIAHAEKHGFGPEAERAAAAIKVLQAKGRAP